MPPRMHGAQIETFIIRVSRTFNVKLLRALMFRQNVARSALRMRRFGAESRTLVSRQGCPFPFTFLHSFPTLFPLMVVVCSWPPRAAR